MTFEVRCRTPYGPFSSPELLDFKAPPAVHTAQGRITDWNREHNVSVAEFHHDARMSTRHKAGAAQYEALLQEILRSTGSAQTPADQPNHKRLACHVTLLKQLLQVGVFGPLQAVMEAILSELLNSALSPQITADPAPGTEKLIASHSKEIHRVPYYQLAAQAEQRLIEQEQQSSQVLHQQAAEAAATSEAAIAALQEHHQTEAAKLQKYSDKLSRHFKAAQQKAAEAEAVHATATAHHLNKLEDKETEIGQWREQLAVLQQRLDRVHIAHQEAEDEEEVLQQLKLACHLPEEQQRAASAQHQLTEALVLEQQLGVLLNAKLDEFEDSKARGKSTELRHEHARFRSEADAIMQQLVALKKYIDSHTRVPAESESAVLTSAALLPQPTADSTQHSQTSSEPPPPPFSTLASCRITPHPSVIPDASGLPQTSLPLGAHSRQPSSNQPVTGRRSLETAKPVGVAEPWQVLDGDADLTAVWNKYQEVFYGDYKPVPSTYRRMSLSSLLRLMAAWIAEKHLEEEVLLDETFADSFFRCLEETYGCGDVASHVAHGCMMAFDQYVGESRMLVFRLHALAGLMPEPVRQYCTNVYCMVYTQADTTDPITLLRGLYPTALPEELVGVAPELAGRQLSPEALKGALVYKVIQQAFTGQELRHRKWCEKVKSSPHRRSEEWDRQDFVRLCVHTFDGETDALVIALCDAVAPDENIWDVSTSIMAYIMCCLEVAEKPYEDPDDM